MELIHKFREFVSHLKPHLEAMLGNWGLAGFYALMFLIVFAETGLVVTPFLPGDSLLFALGAVAASAGLSLPLLFGLLVAAAVLGDAVNYHAGHYLGPKVFRYESSWLLNHKHLLRAQDFYERYGSKTIILARFVPIVRTFAPFVAGIGNMTYRKFFLYNVVGGLAWVALCVGSGYYFGGLDVVKDNFELVLVAIVLLSVLPMAVEYVLARRRAAAAAQRAACEFGEAVPSEQQVG